MNSVGQYRSRWGEVSHGSDLRGGVLLGTTEEVDELPDVDAKAIKQVVQEVHLDLRSCRVPT